MLSSNVTGIVKRSSSRSSIVVFLPNRSMDLRPTERVSGPLMASNQVSKSLHWNANLARKFTNRVMVGERIGRT